MKQGFDEREMSEITHAVFYAIALHHGTVGHNMLMLIAKLVEGSSDPDVQRAVREGIAAAAGIAVARKEEKDVGHHEKSSNGGVEGDAN